MFRKFLTGLAAAGGIALFTATAAIAAPIGAGNLVLSRVGDGVTTPVNSSGPVSVLEYTTAGSLVQTITVSPDATTGLQLSGTATSEGALSLSQDGQSFAIAGYIPPFAGSGSLSSRTDANAPRGYVSIGMDGTVGTPVAIGAYSAGNIRSAVTSNTGAYFAGSNTGTVYNDGSNTTIQSAITNSRIVNIINGKLYFSTGSGASRGVWTLDTDLPTSAATASVMIDMGGSASPYDFAINGAGNVAYITNGDILERWTFDGLSWTQSNVSASIGTGLTGLAVNFGLTEDSIFTLNPSTLYGLTFDGATFSSAGSLATAGANYSFRGLEVAPVPEPSTLALIGAGAIGLVVYRLRRKA